MEVVTMGLLTYFFNLEIKIEFDSMVQSSQKALFTTTHCQKSIALTHSLQYSLKSKFLV